MATVRRGLLEFGYLPYGTSVEMCTVISVGGIGEVAGRYTGVLQSLKSLIRER